MQCKYSLRWSASVFETCVCGAESGEDVTCTLSREKDDSLTSKNYLRLRLRQYIVANVPSSKTVKSIKKGGLSSQQKKIKLGIYQALASEEENKERR